MVIVVPSIAGGSLDTLVRLLAEPLRSILGQPVVVENRGGAGGAIGADYVAKSPPDANRFLASAVHHAILPAIARLPYDSAQDLIAVTDIGASPNALIVPASHPARSVAELVAWARANPGAPYATGGQGTLHHPNRRSVRTPLPVCDLSPVHYRGSAPAIPDLIAGRVGFMFETLPSAAQQIRAGAVRALAVAQPRPRPQLPRSAHHDGGRIPADPGGDVVRLACAARRRGAGSAGTPAGGGGGGAGDRPRPPRMGVQRRIGRRPSSSRVSGFLAGRTGRLGERARAARLTAG